MLRMNLTTKFNLLAELGIEHIFLEGAEGKVLLMTQDAIKPSLEGLVLLEMLSVADVNAINSELSSFNFAPNWKQIKARILTKRIPTKEWKYSFKFAGHPHVNPYGHLYSLEDDRCMDRQPIYTLFDAIILVSTMIEQAVTDQETAIHLLQQIILKDLPSDLIEQEGRLRRQAEYEAQRARH